MSVTVKGDFKVVRMVERMTRTVLRGLVQHVRGHEQAVRERSKQAQERDRSEDVAGLSHGTGIITAFSVSRATTEVHQRDPQRYDAFPGKAARPGFGQSRVARDFVTWPNLPETVVDRRWALVSSANFTDRGLTRNLEAGVLIEDTTFARRLSEQWLALIDSGQMKPYRPK